MLWLFGVMTISLALSMPAAAIAAENASPPGSKQKIERGRDIANKICSACHVIGTSQDFAPILAQPGPDFRDIAKKPNVTADTLTTFLRTTHRTEGKSYTMPAPLLTGEMIDEVTNYILSLRDQR